MKQSRAIKNNESPGLGGLPLQLYKFTPNLLIQCLMQILIVNLFCLKQLIQKETFFWEQLHPDQTRIQILRSNSNRRHKDDKAITSKFYIERGIKNSRRIENSSSREGCRLTLHDHVRTKTIPDRMAIESTLAETLEKNAIILVGPLD